MLKYCYIRYGSEPGTTKVFNDINNQQGPVLSQLEASDAELYTYILSWRKRNASLLSFDSII